MLLAAQQSIFQTDSNPVPNGLVVGAQNGIPSANVSISPTRQTSGQVVIAVDGLTDSDLATQKKSLGPFTERILSALLTEPGVSTSMLPPPTNGEDEAPGAGPSGPTPVNTVTPTPVSFHDLETRMRLELKACGLLGAEEVKYPCSVFGAKLKSLTSRDQTQPDFTESYDDDIASDLRQFQRKLRRVKQKNDARKERLSAIARDRLAYVDYLEMLEDLNRQISAGYQRIVRANQKANAIGKKKKHPGSEKDKEKSAAAAEAAAEAARLKTLVLEVPENLLKLVDIRRQFKDVRSQLLFFVTTLSTSGARIGHWQGYAGLGKSTARSTNGLSAEKHL
jgi:transcriptional adapter 3